MQKHFGLGNYLHKLRFIDEDIITNKKYVKKVHKAAFNGIQEINTIDPKEQEYNENFTKKELELIAGYYEISKRKKRKLDLIQEIIIFEQNDLNYDIVEKRKLHWFYLEQLREDPYLKQFIIINN